MDLLILEILSLFGGMTVAVPLQALTSGMGQTEKNSARAYVFRFALKLGHRST
jgi:hypothetical protein